MADNSMDQGPVSGRYAEEIAVHQWWIKYIPLVVVAALLLGLGAALFFEAWIILVAMALAQGLPIAIYLRVLVHRRKFGEAHFVVPETPIVLGQKLQGEIETGLQPAQYEKTGFSLTLECCRTSERTAHRGSDREVRVTKVLWSETHSTKGYMRAGFPRMVIPVSFDLPDGGEKAVPTGDLGAFWRLKTVGETEGMNYRAGFVFPVIAPPVS